MAPAGDQPPTAEEVKFKRLGLKHAQGPMRRDSTASSAIVTDGEAISSSTLEERSSSMLPVLQNGTIGTIYRLEMAGLLV